MFRKSDCSFKSLVPKTRNLFYLQREPRPGDPAPLYSSFIVFIFYLRQEPRPADPAPLYSSGGWLTGMRNCTALPRVLPKFQKIASHGWICYIIRTHAHTLGRVPLCLYARTQTQTQTQTQTHAHKHTHTHTHTHTHKHKHTHEALGSSRICGLRFRLIFYFKILRLILLVKLSAGAVGSLRRRVLAASTQVDRKKKSS